MNCSTSDIPQKCLFIHASSSTIIHSLRERLPWHQFDMLDVDAVRERLTRALSEKGIAPTGKRVQAAGIGQTTLRNFLDGSSRSITLETLAKLDSELEIDAAWLLFGPPSHRPPISSEVLDEMVQVALGELQPGMSYAEIQPAVAASLNAQLGRVLSVGVELGHADEAIAPDTGAQSRAPTRQSDQEESRNP